MSESAPRTVHELAIFEFKYAQAGVEQIAARDDDDVKARREFVPTKYFT